MMIQLLTNYQPKQKPRLEQVVKDTLEAGCTSIQFCWGYCTDLEYFKKAEQIKRITEAYNAELIVNNRLDVALAIEADGIHIGQNDIPIEQAVKILPSYMKIGYTIDCLSQLNDKRYKLADTIGVSTIYDTTTKQHDKAPLGLDGLQSISNITNKELIAIGGITENNCNKVFKSGANKVAVIGAIYNSSNIAQTVNNIMNVKF